MLCNYIESSNEGIIGGEAEMRNSMVKCAERPLEGGKELGEQDIYEIPYERWCYGNCGIHVDRYLASARFNY